MADNTSSTDIAVTPPRQSAPKWQAMRKWVLRITLGFIIASPLVFMIGALGAKIGLWGWQFGLGFLTRELGPLILFGCLIAGAVSLLLAFLIKPRKGLAIAVIALIIPILAFVRLGQVKQTVASLPLIHDISTDTQDPPDFGSVIQAERAEVEGVNTLDYAGKMAPTRQTDEEGRPRERLVSALQTQAYPEIRTLVVSEPPESAFGRAEQLARDLGWTIKETDMVAGRIEATDTTFWYGFKDDISIRLRPAAGDGTRVDARSVSRVGLSDMGKNAARLKEFLDAMAESEA